MAAASLNHQKAYQKVQFQMETDQNAGLIHRMRRNWS